MKTSFLVLLAVFSFLRSAGQTEEGKPPSSDALQKLRAVFEDVLSGTGIRDLHRDFEVKYDTLSQEYRLHLAPEIPLPEFILDTLHGHINRMLGGAPHMRLMGQVYFDRYTDHALVNVMGYSTDRIFQAIGIMVEPVGGIGKFSRRLHDHLKAEVDKGHIRMDSLTDRTAISVVVERDGSLVNVADAVLRTSLDAYLSQEGKWSPGIMSGRPVAYELKLRLYVGYLQGRTGWPEDAEWQKRQVLYWKKKGRRYLYGSLVRPDAPIASFVYDATLGQYRFPIVHGGSRDDCRQLAMDIQEGLDKPPFLYGAFHRVYFYWSTN
ncbi:hypothetical protein ACFOET_20035 [Parapedobacter deserti]|uniref:TonB C-terminal domain-containing protein n=1 Tax=Parapedobacter deserti TaxID=1912957 RepID=A0ABV7JP87_9SPHI